jgi:hypothetical protein
MGKRTVAYRVLVGKSENRNHLENLSLNARIILKWHLSRRYPYFDVVVRLAWSNDPKSYVDGIIATGRASYARQVKGDDPDKKGYPGSPSWGLYVGLTTSPYKKHIC